MRAQITKGVDRWAPVAACLFFGSAPLGGADLESSVAYQMRRAVPHPHHVRVLTRIKADSKLDLVALSTSVNDVPGFWWGMFLQDRTDPGTVYKVTFERAPKDCDAKAERATATELILSCVPEQGDVRGPNYKFSYDIRSRGLTGKLAYQPFSMPRLFSAGQSAVLVGSDRKTLLAIQFDPLTEPRFRVLSHTAARPWIRRIRTVRDTVGVGAETQEFLEVRQRSVRSLRFGPQGSFALASRQSPLFTMPGFGGSIVEHLSNKVKAYPLPRTTYNEFARLRPQRVRDGYTRAVAEFGEEIGPAQAFDGRLWFGKTFYDGEGGTGVGGFGNFDPKTRKYEIHSVPEIVNWSATAMLVEPEAVWIGLASRGEYGDFGHGLLRFDRQTQECSPFEFPDIIFEIARVRDSVILATNFGAAVVQDRKLRRFFVDVTSGGERRVTEAIFGE
ncbi:MAG: hypothetical protein ACJ74Y_03810 [Bryobacteraceae bacterium]